jgi:hypothetical protein
VKVVDHVQTHVYEQTNKSYRKYSYSKEVSFSINKKFSRNYFYRKGMKVVQALRNANSNIQSF